MLLALLSDSKFLNFEFKNVRKFGVNIDVVYRLLALLSDSKILNFGLKNVTFGTNNQI